MLHGQPVVMMPHPSAGGGHPVGPGFPPPPPPFMQVCYPRIATRLHIVFSNLNKKQYKTYAYQFFKLGFRVELQLICRKCHPHPHQMYILNLATDMEIINETIIAHQIIDMTILRLIEINNPEIIRMVLVFKTSNYNKHLTHVFVYLFFVYKCKYGAF